MRLSKAVSLYVQRKQDAGMRFYNPAYILRAFLRHCGDIDLHHLRSQQVLSFLGSPDAMPSTWRGKRGTLQNFFDYWIARCRLKNSPVPPSVPKISPRFVPYIYTQSELLRLLRAIPECQRRRGCVMSSATFRALLLFLYATGMRLSEALGLRLADLDRTLGVATIRATKFYKARFVPLGSAIKAVIRKHLREPGLHLEADRRLFQTASGDPISISVADGSFAHLRQLAGVERHDGSYFQPRLHDLRHTFAVHRVTDWYRHDHDLQRLLPALSTYLGHVNLNATQRYLSMTPELLRQANLRFERYVDGGSNER